MITTDDVVAAYPQAAEFDADTLAHWIDVANVAVPLERVRDPKTHAQAQMLFVMHHIEKPALNLMAPHVRARIGRPGRAAASVKAPHPWAGTPHGERLIAATKF